MAAERVRLEIGNWKSKKSKVCIRLRRNKALGSKAISTQLRFPHGLVGVWGDGQRAVQPPSTGMT
jgi:hypothetical protein